MRKTRINRQDPVSKGKALLKANQKEAAFYLFQSAAIEGNIAALFFLGRCYDHGQGTPTNREKAIILYSHAAKLNDARAQYALGRILLKKYPTPINETLSSGLFWLTQVIKHANQQTQYLAQEAKIKIARMIVKNNTSFYKKICDRLNLDNEYSQNEIKKIIRDTINPTIQEESHHKTTITTSLDSFNIPKELRELILKYTGDITAEKFFKLACTQEQTSQRLTYTSP